MPAERHSDPTAVSAFLALRIVRRSQFVQATLELSLALRNTQQFCVGGYVANVIS